MLWTIIWDGLLGMSYGLSVGVRSNEDVIDT